jgi:mannose-6-phosphate isomerase-like protein (cupin superfamily)
MKVVRGSEIPYTPASHEDPRDPGVLKRVLATAADLVAGQVQMVNWAKLPVGKSFQTHYHEDMQEVFVIVCGQAEMNVEGKNVQLAEGDAILVAPREIHTMRNIGVEDVHYVVFGISTGQGGRTVNVS